MRKALIYTFATIGCLDLVGRGLQMFLTGEAYGIATNLPMGTDYVKGVTSPDKSMKAILYLHSIVGSGCTEWVAVVDEAVPIGSAWTHANSVFGAVCGDKLQFAWEPQAGTRARPRLRIDADPARGYYRSRLAMGGTVEVAYQGDP